MFIKNCGKEISLILILFSTFAFSQYRAADYELIGNVKSLQSVTRPYNNPSKTTTSGFLDSEMYDSIFLKFDQQKYLILRENYLDYRGKLGIFDKTTYQYNAARQVEKLENTLIQNGEEKRKIAQRKIFYYLKNQLIRMDEFNSGRTSDQFWVVNSVYENNELKEKVFWMDDAQFSRVVYAFDSNHNPVSETTINNNGQKGLMVFYENNSGGMPVRITHQYGNTLTTENIEYGQNYPTQKTETDNDGKIIRKTFFDTNGRIFGIDKMNYQTQQTDHYQFDYKYDSHNNWIYCVVYSNQVPTFIITRTINYYYP